MKNPKVRFKDSNGQDFPDWESKTFEETFESLNNNTFSRDMLNYENGIAKNIHYGDILVEYGAICDVQRDKIPYVNEDYSVDKFNALKNGDVVFADTAEDETVGKSIELFNINSEKIISGLHTMACRPKSKYAPKFLGYYTNSQAFHNQLFPYMQGIKVTSINRKNIANTKISIPCLEEQKKIAEFLSAVDEVVTHTERELQNLQTQKKAVMQSIFSQKVRFKDANGQDYPNWESKKLGDISTRVKRKNKNNETDIPLTIASQYGLIDQRDFFNKVVASKDMSNYYLLKKGEYAYNKSYSNGFDFGSIKRLNLYECGALSSLYICFAINDKYNSDFFEKYFDSLKWYDDVRKMCSEGARNHGLLNISPDDFFNAKIPVPCLEEQEKIAEFLTAFDVAITKTARELELYRTLKKGLLQQLFT